VSVGKQPAGETQLSVDPAELRGEIRFKYEEVATRPDGTFHFFTGRKATRQCGYPDQLLEGLPERAVEAFAGVANPFLWGLPQPGERVVDIGSGGGLDSIIAARAVGPTGQVVGVEMTPSMLDRSRRSAEELDLHHVDFRQGLAESLPLPDGWADLVISNGVFNLIPDKNRAYREVERVLKPGGRLQGADICVERPVPEGATRDIDLWTG
jgi:arsenite methyltransferase